MPLSISRLYDLVNAGLEYERVLAEWEKQATYISSHSAHPGPAICAMMKMIRPSLDAVRTVAMERAKLEGRRKSIANNTEAKARSRSKIQQDDSPVPPEITNMLSAPTPEPITTDMNSVAKAQAMIKAKWPTLTPDARAHIAKEYNLDPATGDPK